MDKTPVQSKAQSWRTPLSSSSGSSAANVSQVHRLSDDASVDSGPGSGSASNPLRPRSRRRSSGLGPRPNPFDSQMSDLRLPFMSPSVFSVVESPSNQTSSSGRFWSVDQQASLFPANISEDSPFKQANATSVLDPEMEDKTQEAINLYFSRHHDITSPEDPVGMSNMSVRQPMNASSAVLASPVLVASSSRRESNEDSCITDPNKVTQSTQTMLSLPLKLPIELERLLSPFMRCEDSQEKQPRRSRTMPNMSMSIDEQSNLSNSTLRRKLFDGIVDDDSSDDDLNLKKLDDNSDERPDMSQAGLDEKSTEQQHRPGSANDHLMSSPIKTNELFSPETLPLTPISKMARTRDPTWSSSPVKGAKRTSMTPPNKMGSPTFSPIPAMPYKGAANKENQPH